MFRDRDINLLLSVHILLAELVDDGTTNTVDNVDRHLAEVALDCAHYEQIGVKILVQQVVANKSGR